ncbi:NAD(P)/FAD-dependent oxidoreductase [Kiloniella antarctica]|uniref:NAD(P)/FAD-dependent oxidoreductase n=1 Tax=Kiloniella antarctica TaxID=1550907 RepID=A0ABW5BNS5_9PROT
MTDGKSVVKYDVVVVGAGMVGISCALWLQKSGLSVCLIDRQPPGASTASGSACTFADYACIPINSPSLPLNIPAMVLKKDSPLAIKWNYIHRMLPWLGQFLSNCRPHRVTHIIDGLAGILSHAESGLMPLIEEAGATDLIQHRGCLYLYNSVKGFDAAGADILARRERGVSLREISASEVQDLEPALEHIFHKGVFFNKAFQFLFPGKLIERFTEHFVRQGGVFLSENVRAIENTGTKGVSIQCDQTQILTEKAVVAAGAHALALLPALAWKMPLETERGYHIMLKANNVELNRPVGWAEKGFYMTPLEDQIRIAGTVELGGLQTNYTDRLLNYMEATAKEVLPGLGARESSWLGFRPSMPDALPVIGPSPQDKNIILAFGHQHVGLTLGGITGKIVSSIVEGKDIAFDISPYSPQRFQ